MVDAQTLVSDLQQAATRLEEALALPEDKDIYRDGTIQRFEFTFELCWKLMKAILADQGIEAYGVKTIIREAAKIGIIDDPTVWFDGLESRNLASHTYNQTISRQVYAGIKTFIPTLKAFLQKAEEYCVNNMTGGDR